MEAVGHILPIALAVAISSVPIMATIAILLSPGRNRSALLFLIGWVFGLVVVVLVFTLTAQLVPTSRREREPDIAVAVIEIVVGLILVAGAVFAWRRARRHPRAALPGWLKSSRSLRPWEAFGVAFFLNLRPKGVLLAIAAGLTIRADANTPTETIVALAVYTVVGASTVAVPIVATLVDPSHWEPRLVRVRDWMHENGDALTSLILLFIGVVIVGAGIARL